MSVNMGMCVTLEGEPPGEPDHREARALNPFSRAAGEGGRRPDEGDRAELESADNECKHGHVCHPGGRTSR